MSNLLQTRKYPTREELHNLVREDSILPENVRPSEGMSLITVSDIETVLLVGATGTLGPYILKELSHRPNIKKIICLVRGTKDASPMERLQKRLDIVCIADQVNWSKVECIGGDIAEEKLGLSDEEYNGLAKTVEAIFNSAARVSYLAQYYKATEKNGKPGLRDVNVQGTIRILELAVHKKLKHIYHASSLLAVITANDEGRILEDWQDVDIFDNCSYTWGYPLSKHISELLCRQAVERGIPCKVFRHPVIGGDSKTGRCEYATNHFILRWMTYLKLNCMPDTHVPIPILPVDICAQISLDIFFNPRAPLDLYNITQREVGTEHKMMRIAEELGISIELVSYTDFFKKSSRIDGSPLSPFHAIYGGTGVADGIYSEYENPTMNFYKKYAENRTAFYKSRKLAQLLENYDGLESTESVMRRDIRFLKESGVFEKLGIKYSHH